MSVSDVTAPGGLVAITDVEGAVKATIRRVAEPATRQRMWDEWTERIAGAAQASPSVMP